MTMLRRKRTSLPLPSDQRTLSDARPDDRFLIVMMRQWLDGLNKQQEVWNTLAQDMGAMAARRFLNSFEAFIAAIADGALRHLSRYRSCCPYLGDDEALIAEIVHEAGRGELDNALRLAARIVRQDALTAVVGQAVQLGVQLKTIKPRTSSTHFAKPTIH